MKITLSLAQMQIQLGHVQENLAQATQAIKEASLRDSHLVLLPELWSTGYDLASAHRLAEENRLILPELARLSRQLSIFIGGSVLLKQDGQIFNTFLFYAPDGSQPAVYQKIHLFRLMEEDRWLAPGDQLQIAQPAWGKTGLAICYDLRFPEMFRHYALAGAELMLISAEWPLRRVAHWQVLLRARAIENQAFVAATNCVGRCGDETFGGSSAIVSPWGEVLAEGSSQGSDLLTASIDLDEVEQARRTIPVLTDRRADLYG